MYIFMFVCIYIMSKHQFFYKRLKIKIVKNELAKMQTWLCPGLFYYWKMFDYPVSGKMRNSTTLPNSGTYLVINCWIQQRY